MQTAGRVGIVGAGPESVEWVTRLLSRGLDVVMWSPETDPARLLDMPLKNAWRAARRLGVFPDASLDKLVVAQSIEEVTGGVDFLLVVTQGDHDVLLHLDETTRADLPIIVSGALPEVSFIRAERIVSVQPERPVYLLPAIEILQSSQNTNDVLSRVTSFMHFLGMKPVWTDLTVLKSLRDTLRRESNRLQETGHVSEQDVDDLFLHGSGLLSAVFGPNAMETARTTADPDLQVLRDDCVIAVMQALRAYQQGAGQLLQEDETRRITAGQEFPRWRAGEVVPAPLAIYQSNVLPEWVDYNGHMTEAAYLTAFGWASDALFRYIGDDEAYRESGLSFYTVETHINYFQECSSGDPLRFTTQLLGGDEKRMHLFHSMYHGHSGELLATTEQMLLHVDMHAGRTCPIREDVFRALQAVLEAHGSLETPKQVGRQMAIRKR